MYCTYYVSKDSPWDHKKLRVVGRQINRMKSDPLKCFERVHWTFLESCPIVLLPASPIARCPLLTPLLVHVSGRVNLHNLAGLRLSLSGSEVLLLG